MNPRALGSALDLAPQLGIASHSRRQIWYPQSEVLFILLIINVNHTCALRAFLLTSFLHQTPLSNFGKYRWDARQSPTIQIDV